MLIQEGNESDAMNPDISKLKKGKYVLKLLESTFLIVVLSFVLHVISQLFSCCPVLPYGHQIHAYLKSSCACEW